MTFDEWLIARLRLWGAYSGAYDGAHGRGVIQALERFQRAARLLVSGQADAATVAALRLDPGSKIDRSVDVQVPAEPVWMREARRFMGLKEIPGPKSNPTIISWAKSVGGWVASFFTNDDTAWCGLFVGHVIAQTLPRELLPKNPLGALEYNKLGRRLVNPALGAIVTFTRSGGGHVAFYMGEDATHYHVLGGNQKNSVSITRIEKDRLSQFRWPNTGEAPVGGRIMLTAAGVPVSTNEA
jgi:uncharacterized protein (TIGR02594 family)